MVPASWSGRQYTSSHLVKLSIAVRMYRLHLSERGNGPSHQSPLFPSVSQLGTVEAGLVTCLWGPLRAVHLSHRNRSPPHLVFVGPSRSPGEGEAVFYQCQSVPLLKVPCTAWRTTFHKVFGTTTCHRTASVVGSFYPLCSTPSRLVPLYLHSRGQ